MTVISCPVANDRGAQGSFRVGFPRKLPIVLLDPATMEGELRAGTRSIDEEEREFSHPCHSLYADDE